jgi:hypothetical protein
VVVKHLASYAVVLNMLISGSAWAESSVQITSDELRLRSGTDEMGIRNKKEIAIEGRASAIGADVEMTGVAVINGEVYIDGEKLPPGKRSFTSKKTGKNYAIEWGKNGNVSVAEK